METFDPDFLAKVHHQHHQTSPNDVQQLLYDPLKLIFTIKDDEQPASTTIVDAEEWLYGMWYWLRRSRSYWYGQIARKHPPEMPSRAIHEIISGMLQRQELIYLRSLLDHLQSTTTQPVTEAVFSFINQAFVDSPGLIKEVHRAEFLYDSKLIPVLVEKVPAMHAAMEVAHGLCTSEYEEAQRHGELLLAYLALQYPSPKTLNFVKLLLKDINHSDHTLHVLTLISYAFPDLIPDCKIHLKDAELELFEAALKPVEAHLKLPIYYPPKAPGF